MSQTRYKQWKDRTKKERVEYALTRYTGAIQRQSILIKSQKKTVYILRAILWSLVAVCILEGLAIGGVIWLK